MQRERERLRGGMEREVEGGCVQVVGEGEETPGKARWRADSGRARAREPAWC